MADQHRRADRVVNRGKQPDRREPGGQLPEGMGKAGGNRRGAKAKKKHRQHVAPAPPVAEPAGRHRARAEHHKTAQSQRDQLAVGPGEIARHAEHRGGKNQHRQMVEEMADIDKADHTGPRARHDDPPLDSWWPRHYISRPILLVRSMIVAKQTKSKSTNRDDYQHTPRPLAGMAKDFADGARIAPHRHPRAQLTWAAAGVMTVTAARGAWVVPPNRALWIPAETEHAIAMSGPVEMRAIYVDRAVADTIAADCKVIRVTPLLRALMLELVAAPLDYDEGGRLGHVAALFLDEIRRLDQEPLYIPMPADRRLRRVCEALLEDPARPESLAEWSLLAGARCGLPRRWRGWRAGRGWRLPPGRRVMPASAPLLSCSAGCSARRPANISSAAPSPRDWRRLRPPRPGAGQQRRGAGRGRSLHALIRRRFGPVAPALRAGVSHPKNFRGRPAVIPRLRPGRRGLSRVRVRLR